MIISLLMEHNDIICILNEYSDTCSKYTWVHKYNSEKYKQYNMIINYISIFFTGFTGVSNNITYFINNMNLTIYLVYSFILYIITILNLIQHFLDLEKKSNEYYSYSLKFNLLYENINRFLALKKIPDNEYYYMFKKISSEYDNLMINMPLINEYIIKNYEKKFNTNFYKIIKLNEIKINSITENSLSDIKRLEYDFQRFHSHF